MIARHLRKPGYRLAGECSNDREVQMAIDEWGYLTPAT
jgi:hypothetical protein